MKIWKAGSTNEVVPKELNNEGYVMHPRNRVIGWNDRIRDFFNPGPKHQEDKKNPKER